MGVSYRLWNYKFLDMPSASNIQEKFVKLIKDALPSHVSLADELSELLNISSDSAYRRIRGDTLFLLDEIILLGNKFNISIDSLSEKDDFVSFRYLPMDHKHVTMEKLFKIILDDLDQASKVTEAELFYLARDMPIFHLLHLPGICSFKIYFWQKMHGDPNMKLPKYNPDGIDRNLVLMGRKIWDEFIKFPSTEIWGIATVEALIEEIAFMWDSSQIENKEIAVNLCDNVIELINHIKKQTEVGYKFSYDVQPIERKDNLKFYFTETQLTHNKVLINGDIKRVYLPASLDTLITSDEHYFDRSYFLLTNSIRRSTLISETGEITRNKFFDSCISMASKLKARIEIN